MKHKIPNERDTIDLEETRPDLWSFVLQQADII
jgi:hypothetical protein